MRPSADRIEATSGSVSSSVPVSLSIAATLVSALPVAALLWLGAAVAARARAEHGETRLELLLVALGVATVGLWWPLHGGLTASRADPLAGALMHLVAASAMAALVVVAAGTSGGDDPWHSARRLGSGAVSLLLAAACIAASSLAGSTALLGWVMRCGVGGAVLAGALIALSWPLQDTARARALRISAAAAGALSLSLAPALPPAVSSPWTSTGVAPVACVLMIGAALLLLLQRPVALVPRLAWRRRRTRTA
jgi:hypothetical protein